MNTIVIGKIPAYNSKISSTNGIDYQNRLLNNLTVTEFTPIGYSINITDFQNIYKLGQKLSPFSIGSDASILGNKVSTYNALKQWQNMQIFSGVDKPCDAFKIIATNDSTINETLINQYKSNVLDNVGTWAGNKFLGGAFTTATDFIAGTVGNSASLDTGAALSLLENLQTLTDNQATNVLLGKMVGIQTAFPKIWSNSEYNNTSSFTIKLISPSGHPTDIINYIIKPLRALILSASPVTFDGISYGFPPLWAVEAKGMISMKLAAVTALTISRGGQDTLFNRFNQPTNIDVRITVEPVIQGFASPLMSGISEVPDAEGNIRMIVQSPSSILKPMGYDSKIDDLSPTILKPLNLR